MRRELSQTRFWLFCIPSAILGIFFLIRLIVQVVIMAVEDGAPMRVAAIGGIAFCFLSALLGITFSPWAWIGVLPGFGVMLQALSENLRDPSEEVEEPPPGILVFDR